MIAGRRRETSAVANRTATRSATHLHSKLVLCQINHTRQTFSGLSAASANEDSLPEYRETVFATALAMLPDWKPRAVVSTKYQEYLDRVFAGFVRINEEWHAQYNLQSRVWGYIDFLKAETPQPLPWLGRLSLLRLTRGAKVVDMTGENPHIPSSTQRAASSTLQRVPVTSPT